MKLARVDAYLTQLELFLIDQGHQNTRKVSLLPLRNNVPARQSRDLLDDLFASAQSLGKCTLDLELRSALTELNCVIRNYQHFPLTIVNEVDAIGIAFPARNWLRTIPQAPARLANGDSLVLLLLAHWEVLNLVVMDMIPLDDPVLSLRERQRSVANLLHRFEHPIIARPSTEPQVGLSQAERKVHQMQERARVDWIHVARASLVACQIEASAG